MLPRRTASWNVYMHDDTHSDNIAALPLPPNLYQQTRYDQQYSAKQLRYSKQAMAAMLPQHVKYI